MHVDMGSTLVEAVDKRRAGVDLTPIPEDLRPLLEKMLAADPAKRLRSMDEVLAVLDEQGRPATIPPVTSFPHETSVPPTSTIPPLTTAAPATMTTLPPHALSTPPIAAQALPRPVAPAKSGSPMLAIVLIVLATVAVGGGAVYYVMSQQKPSPRITPATNGTSISGPVVIGAGPATSFSDHLSDNLSDLSCSWLDVVGPLQNGQTVKLSGAAGSPATIGDAVVDAAKEAGDTLPANGGVDISAVAQADQGACAALDAFRSFRAPAGAGPALASAQPSYQITRAADGKLAGEPTITLAPRSPAQDFALLRLDTAGRINVVYGSRQAFNAARQSNASIVDQGSDAYTVQAEALNAPGATGLLLLTGAGPFDPSLLARPPSARDVSWIDQVRQAATAGGWKSSMTWYKVQNNAPLAPVRPRQRPSSGGGGGGDNSGGYTPHPDNVEPVPIRDTMPTRPLRTQPVYPQPPPRRQTAWQRMFGSNGGGPTHY